VMRRLLEDLAWVAVAMVALACAFSILTRL
jgi:hypothetical protein